MESFQKLKNNFIPNRYEILNSRIKFGDNVNGEFEGIEYFDVYYPDSYSLYKVIPSQYWENFCMTLMKINTVVPPHTDTGINVTINFYLQTDDCVTQFYKFKNEPKKHQIKNQTNGFIFEESDLEKTSKFIAEKNQVYVLDVSQPHSVKPLYKMKERFGLSLATNTYNYQQVCNMLTETGNL
jgi:hypothetical protein